jgi:dienelactone hydrolase
VWVQKKGVFGDCIKYWAAGFDQGVPTPRAIIFFAGDAWLAAGVTSDLSKNGEYLRMTEEKLQSMANDWHKKLQHPYIFVGRPGMYGSSGDHMQRRRPYESQLVSKALDLIKERYGIKELIVVGQSGGGHVTSSLITERSDIVCAVPTSAPSSPRIRYEHMGRHSDTTLFKDSYEPGEHVNRSIANPHLRVFILGSPNDDNVPWAAQTTFADRLKEAGIPVQVLTGEGIGPQHHGLGNSGRVVAGWCAHGLSDEEILARAAKGLKS